MHAGCGNKPSDVFPVVTHAFLVRLMAKNVKTLSGVPCPPAPIIGNATSSTNMTYNTIFVYEDAVQYLCILGYTYPDGVTEQNVTCLANSSWSSHFPHCERELITVYRRRKQFDNLIFLC